MKYKSIRTHIGRFFFFGGLIILAGAFLLYLNKETIIEALSYNPNYDYNAILKLSPAYIDSDNRPVHFSYAESSDNNLTQLRTRYALDTVAGTGTDFEKATKLLSWLHKLIPQDGNAGLPQNHDSLTLIDYAKSNNQGLNCKGLAIILNEALLSVGIKSRYIELLPKNISSESHVVTAAYISELNKWVYLDPSYNAYFLDEQNIPMSPAEIRQSFVKDTTPKTNSDISWRGGQLDVVYTHYISKNIYRFGSLVHSGFGSDSISDRKFVILNPTGDIFDIFHKPFSSTVTNSEQVFWAKP